MKDEYFNYLLLISLSYGCAIILALILRKMFNVIIKRNSSKDDADPTNLIFIKNSISFLLLLIATSWVFHKIPYLKNLGTALFAGAGVLVAIVGFASQKAFSNIISGIFLLIFKPFKVGEAVRLSSDNLFGVVENITLRHTVIRDFEFKRIIIPNSRISEDVIVNSSIEDAKIRKHLEFDISYDSNIDKAMDIMRTIISDHQFFVDNRTEDQISNGDPAIDIRVVNLGDFSIKLRAYVWAEDYVQAFVLQTDCLKAVKEKFDQESIEIPFPYRTIVYKDKTNTSTD